MIITSWNVNGLRSVINKGALDWIRKNQPDVICFQEIKAHPHQIDNSTIQWIDEYNAYWHPAERPGYSGVVTFSLDEPEIVQLGLGERRFDIEGRAIFTRFSNFVLINVYVPNGKRNHERLAFKLDFYQRLLDECDKLHKSGMGIIICGDINTAHREIDLKNPGQNKNTSGFLPVERSWIDKYLEHGFVDVFREKYPYRVQYTWWTYRVNARKRNIGWRIDYFLASDYLLPAVKGVRANDEILGSDHCPITLEIDESKL